MNDFPAEENPTWGYAREVGRFDEIIVHNRESVLRDHRATAPGRLSTKQFLWSLMCARVNPGSLYRSCFPSRSAIRCAIPFSSPLRSSCHFVTETTVTPMETNASRRIESFAMRSASA